MNPQDALNVIYEASKRAALNFQDHVVCSQAFEYLKKVISGDTTCQPCSLESPKKRGRKPKVKI